MNATLAGLGVLLCIAASAAVGVALGRVWERDRRSDPGWVRYHNHPALPSVVQVLHAGLVRPHVQYCDHHERWGRLVVGFADGTSIALDSDFGELAMAATSVAPALAPPRKRFLRRRLGGTHQTDAVPRRTAGQLPQ